MKTAFPFATILTLLVLPVLPLKSWAESPPTRIGQCAETSVVKVATRLVEANNQPVPGSGTVVQFTNGVNLVSYETVPQAEASRPGDKVTMCLKSVPKNCPPGDNRGKFYTVTNMRTKKVFTLPDSQHMCGGA
ncbi:MAG: hypothetical protein U1F42_03695 [Candidatus Competibacteraceae bacterium]